MTVETLVRENEAPEAAVEPAPGAPSDQTPPEATVEVERPCPRCGAALAPDQEWCVECGAAAGDRSGGLPGWRTAAATIAACLVLASGAVAAAYAALSSTSDTDNGAVVANAAAAPGDTGDDLGAAPPIGAAPAAPAATPPASAATPPAATPPAATPPAAEAPASTPAPAPAPAATPAPAPAPTHSGSAKGEGDTAGAKDEAPLPEVEQEPLKLVELGPEAATTYDPAARPTLATADPKLALDGDAATAWTAPLAPEEIATPNVGLLIDLEDATAPRRLTVTPTTPGTTIHVYGTKQAEAPATLDDEAWTELAKQLDVEGKTRINLGDGKDKVRQVLVWFAEGPVDASPSVGISELKLFA
jgi:hypothetical protein